MLPVLSHPMAAPATHHLVSGHPPPCIRPPTTLYPATHHLVSGRLPPCIRPPTTLYPGTYHLVSGHLPPCIRAPTTLYPAAYHLVSGRLPPCIRPPTTLYPAPYHLVSGHLQPRNPQKLAGFPRFSPSHGHFTASGPVFLHHAPHPLSQALHDAGIRQPGSNPFPSGLRQSLRAILHFATFPLRLRRGPPSFPRSRRVMTATPTVFHIIRFCDQTKALGHSRNHEFPTTLSTMQAPRQIGAAWRVLSMGASWCLRVGRDPSRALSFESRMPM